jgi:hypothetical protein
VSLLLQHKVLYSRMKGSQYNQAHSDAYFGRLQLPHRLVTEPLTVQLRKGLQTSPGCADVAGT